ncbi:hypothetical protein ACJX0J_028654, partial [Zea mays]
ILVGGIAFLLYQPEIGIPPWIYCQSSVLRNPLSGMVFWVWTDDAVPAFTKLR